MSRMAGIFIRVDDLRHFPAACPLLARTGKILLSAGPELNKRGIFRDAFEGAENRTKEPDHIQEGMKEDA